MLLLKIRGPAIRAKNVFDERPRTPVSDCIRRRWKSRLPLGAAPFVAANDKSAEHRRLSTSDKL